MRFLPHIFFQVRPRTVLRERSDSNGRLVPELFSRCPHSQPLAATEGSPVHPARGGVERGESLPSGLPASGMDLAQESDSIASGGVSGLGGHSKPH